MIQRPAGKILFIVFSSVALLPAVALLPTNVQADIRVPVKPLETRVKEADKVFEGVLINRKLLEGDWCHADLKVTKAIKGCMVDELVPVVWRPRVARYDASEKQQGLAILKPAHKKRYWLRSDTFEDAKLVGQVLKFYEANTDADVPAQLPDPDGKAGDATKPVKVYILAGQSNMVGMGDIGGAKNMYSGVFLSSDPAVPEGPLQIYKVGNYKISQLQTYLPDGTKSDKPLAEGLLEVLLIRGTIDLPPLQEDHRYRIVVGGAAHVNSGEGYALYVNGKLLAESATGVAVRQGGQPRGGFIYNDIRDEFHGGKVTIAATSFLRYNHPRHGVRPSRGHFWLRIEEQKLPPIAVAAANADAAQ